VTTKAVLKKREVSELEENMMFFESYLNFFEHQAAKSVETLADTPHAAYYEGMLFGIKRCREFFLECRSGKFLLENQTAVQNWVDSAPDAEYPVPVRIQKKEGS